MRERAFPSAGLDVTIFDPKRKAAARTGPERKRAISALFALAGISLLSACAAAPSSQPPATSTDTGLDRMERLTLTANRCWIKSKDPAFATYTLAPELSSFSGKPRFLLVPRGKPEARPLLVVEGQSGSTNVATYGPLMNQRLAGRIAGDIGRWGNGSASCTA